MLSFLKPNPTKKLRKQYEQALEQAMRAQRSGDIKAYSFLMRDADALWKRIEQQEKSQ